MFRYEKLDGWHKAIAFASRVYEITKSFPADERFGLTSQMRRAVVSLSSNIAEGSSRTSDADFSRFIEISYGSLMEVVSQSVIAKQHGFVAEDQQQDLYELAQQLGRMLSGLKPSLSK